MIKQRQLAKPLPGAQPRQQRSLAHRIAGANQHTAGQHAIQAIRRIATQKQAAASRQQARAAQRAQAGLGALGQAGKPGVALQQGGRGACVGVLTEVGGRAGHDVSTRQAARH
jgi:hypothetical protein